MTTAPNNPISNNPLPSIDSLIPAYKIIPTKDIPVKKSSSRLVILIILLIITGFAAGAYYLKNYKQPTNYSITQNQPSLFPSLLASNNPPSFSPSLLPVPSSSSPLPSASPSKSPVITRSIFLTGAQAANGVYLTWRGNNLNLENGVKILKNTSVNPAYPANDSINLSDPSVLAYNWPVADGQSWHFRVCQKIGDNCGIYSNDIVIKVPINTLDDNAYKISSLFLTVSIKSGNQAQLNWTAVGNAPAGFKIIWSQNPNPSYPAQNNEQVLWLDSFKRETIVNSLTSGKTYYFRICEYLGDKCGQYSNEVSLGF